MWKNHHYVLQYVSNVSVSKYHNNGKYWYTWNSDSNNNKLIKYSKQLNIYLPNINEMNDTPANPPEGVSKMNEAIKLNGITAKPNIRNIIANELDSFQSFWNIANVHTVIITVNINVI